MKIKLIKIRSNDYITITLLFMFISLLMEMSFHVNSFVYFLIDIPILVMLIRRYYRVVNILKKKYMIGLILLLFVMILSVFISVIINRIPISNIVYGSYRFFRPFLFFLCTVSCVDEKSINCSIGLIKVVYWLNFIITMLQFCVWGLRQDNLGGIFGTTVGVNQYTNLFFVFISIYIISALFSKKINFKLAIPYITSMFLVAALAEIKFFFFEFLIMCLCAFLIEKKDVKTFAIIIVIIIATVIGYNLLIKLFPEFSNLIRAIMTGGFSKIYDLQRHYSNDYDVGRAVAFEYVNENFLTTAKNKLFGLGIGIASSSNIVDNSFYIHNVRTHYDAFYHCYLYIEQGICGVVSFSLFFLYFLKRGLMKIKGKDDLYPLMAVLSAVSGIMLFIYNMSIQGNMSFLLFWLLAVINVGLQNKELE